MKLRIKEATFAFARKAKSDNMSIYTCLIIFILGNRIGFFGKQQRQILHNLLRLKQY